MTRHVRDPAIAERLKNWAAVGLPQKKAAVLEGIDQKTLTRHYRTEWDEGDARASANVGKSLYDLAVGRPAEYDPKTGKLIREEIKPDKSAAIFASKARLGFRETQAVEHSGPGGGPVDLNLAGLTTAEKRTFLDLLRKAKGTTRTDG